MNRIYIAGPMRGLPLYNFPAFDEAAARFRSAGWEVINPAEMDRARGFDETQSHTTAEFLKQAIMADLEAIAECTAIALLPGWQKSQGVAVEIALARFLGLAIFDATKVELLEGEFDVAVI